MSATSDLYPLRFDPIYQYRLWGGRHFERLLALPLPPDQPIGEAWLLSDRDDYPSRVADGPLAGQTIGDLIAARPDAMLGRFAERFQRFPLLLKFLDAREMLSVQVHPTDDQPDLLPPGELGKTEAWIVLESDPDSRIYAGLQHGAGPEDLASLTRETADVHLASFHPRVGDGLFIPAGTVHALGGGIVVFEVQQNSDVTFRLYDWDRVDAATGKPRDLHIGQALKCIDYARGPVGPVKPIVESHAPFKLERLFDTTHFRLWRLTGAAPMQVGIPHEPTILVCAEGSGELAGRAVRTGDVYMLPAALGQQSFAPKGRCVVFEIALP